MKHFSLRQIELTASVQGNVFITYLEQSVHSEYVLAQTYSYDRTEFFKTDWDITMFVLVNEL